jgi:hypothetical protein
LRNHQTLSILNGAGSDMVIDELPSKEHGEKILLFKAILLASEY